MTFYIIIIAGCLIGSLLIMQGVTYWLKSDMIRATSTAAMGLFIVLSLSTISVVTAVDDLLEQKIQEYGIDNTTGAITEWKYPNG